MNEKIAYLIESYVQNYNKKDEVITRWKKPLIGFASTQDTDFKSLKSSVDTSHLMPEDLVVDSQTVIAYFIPFEESIVQSNSIGDRCSREWAIAYIETNQLINDLNKYIIEFIEGKGYKSALIPATHNFDEEKLISQWSHRHVAKIAGLGSFGINNMLITESGCCGRVGSIVTTIELKPTKKMSLENCLYKFNGSCGVCVDRCKFDALNYVKFNRKKCYEVLLENDAYHSDLELTDACGKCCVDLPCSFKNPLNIN